MLLVHVDVAALGLLRHRHLLLKLLVDLTATEGRDLELHGVDLIAEIFQLANQALVSAAGQVTGLVDGKGFAVDFDTPARRATSCRLAIVPIHSVFRFWDCLQREAARFKMVKMVDIS